MENTEALSELIKGLLAYQHFAVIATQSQGQPYSNLIAFAEADNLKGLLFVTSRDTKKYSNTIVSKRVAILVDNRTNQASDFNKAIAITALGTIKEVTMDGKEYLSKIFYLLAVVSYTWDRYIFQSLPCQNYFSLQSYVHYTRTCNRKCR